MFRRTERTRSEVLVTQSLIDRLTPCDDWPGTRSASLRMYREGIKRDVEWLLNSRKPFSRKAEIKMIEEYELAADSVLVFGLPDLTQLHFRDPNSVMTAILQMLQVYEPRIREPRVHLVRSDVLGRSMTFHIDGVLLIEDGEEEISFDTVLEITSGEYEVK